MLTISNMRFNGGAPLFAELHAVSSYSFLGGASEPEQLVARASSLGLSALGLCDRDGFYGVVKFAEAAAKAGVATVFGAELTLEEGVLPVLARGAEGYRRLSRLMSRAHMMGVDSAIRYFEREFWGEKCGEGVCGIPHA